MSFQGCWCSSMSSVKNQICFRIIKAKYLYEDSIDNITQMRLCLVLSWMKCSTTAVSIFHCFIFFSVTYELSFKKYSDLYLKKHSHTNKNSCPWASHRKTDLSLGIMKSFPLFSAIEVSAFLCAAFGFLVCSAFGNNRFHMRTAFSWNWTLMAEGCFS